MDEYQQLAINGAIFDKLVICQKQRDELLAALKEALEYYRLQSQPKAARDVLKLMREAIAKCKA